MSYTHADSPLNKPFYNINANSQCPAICAKNCNGVLDLLCTSAKLQCGCGGSGFSEGILNPIRAVTGQPQVVANKPVPDSATLKCSLSSQDQDCCNYLGAGGLFDGMCVAGKSITKGVGGGINLPGCGVLAQVPVLGTLPCWGIVLGALGMLAVVMFKRR